MSARNQFKNPHLPDKQASENGYKVFLTNEAQQIMDSAGSFDQLKMCQNIQKLAGLPRPQDSGQRIGATDSYRIAVGHYRLDYVIFSGTITISNISLDQHDAEKTKHEKPGLYLVKKLNGIWTKTARIQKASNEYGAVNGQANTLRKATDLMGKHVAAAFKKENISEYCLYHNPSTGFFGDSFESTLDKLGITTEVTKQYAAILDDVQTDKKETKWVVHSQGGIIFSEAVAYHLKTKGTSLSYNKVQFDAGANNAWLTQRNLTAAGIEKINEDNNHPYDLVPNVVGMNTANPVKIIGSVLAIPLLFMGGEQKSPHTLTNTRTTTKFWTWKD